MMEQYLGLFHSPSRNTAFSLPLSNSHKRELISETFQFFLPENNKILNTSDYFCYLDGYITNTKEVKKELALPAELNNFELIIMGHQRLGQSFFKKLNGSWVCTIYDKMKKEIVIARDHLGQKPLFYVHVNKSFAFAYDLNLLLKLPFVSKNISPLALQKYYIYSSVPAPLTLFENVYALPPASVLVFSENTDEICLSTYWNYTINTTFQTIPTSELKEEFLALLNKSIKHNLAHASRPAVAVSGGLDSSTSLYFAHKACPNNLLSLSIHFEQKSFDESYYISLARKAFNQRHESLSISSQLLRTNFSKIKESLPLGMGDASFIPCYFLNQMAKEKTDLLLTGDGADELFCGYDPFHAISMATKLHFFLPKAFLHFARRASTKLQPRFDNLSIDFKLKQFFNGLDQNPRFWPALWMSSLKQDDFKEAFLTPLPTEILLHETEELFKESAGNFTKFIQLYFINIYFPNVVQMKAERASRVHGVKTYSPFLDLEMIEFSSRLPLSLKYKNGITKFFMKESLKGLIPQEIIQRKKKGFGSPIAYWFSEGSLQINPQKHSSLIDKDFLQKAINSHRSKKENYHQFLWNCLALEHMESR